MRRNKRASIHAHRWVKIKILCTRTTDTAEIFTNGNTLKTRKLSNEKLQKINWYKVTTKDKAFN